MLTIIVPVFNEESVIAEFHERITQVMKASAIAHEVFYIDDGSIDSTGKILDGLGARVVHLSQNRGYGAALKIGITRSASEHIAIIDCDGTYDPGDLPVLFAHMDACDMAIGKRTTKFGMRAVSKMDFTDHSFLRRFIRDSRSQFGSSHFQTRSCHGFHETAAQRIFVYQHNHHGFAVSSQERAVHSRKLRQTRRDLKNSSCQVVSRIFHAYRPNHDSVRTAQILFTFQFYRRRHRNRFFNTGHPSGKPCASINTHDY